MSCDSQVQLADIQRPIALFAQGIAGRFLHLKPSDTRGREQAAGNDDAAGESIELPAAITDFDSSAHNLGAYRIAVLRQIGYLNDGTADFSVARARESLPLIHAAGTPSPKLSELEHFFALWSRPTLMQRIFLTLEAWRIDGLIAARYPGAAADLARARSRALATRPVGVMGPQMTAAESLLRYTLGGSRSGLPEELFARVDELRGNDADVYASAEVAVAICKALDTRFHSRSWGGGLNSAKLEVPSADSQYIQAPEETEGVGLDLPAEFGSQVLFRRRRGGQVGNLESASSMLTTGIPDQEAGERKPGRGPGASNPAGRARLAAPGQARSYLYDEWNYHAQTYLRAYCRVYEQRLRGDRFSFIDDVHRRHALLAQQVRRQFGFIRPESWHRVRRTNDGDELELDGVIEAVIDRRSTGASDSQLYIRRDRALRDVAAAFLTDMSASTGFPLPDVAPVSVRAGAAAEYAPYFHGGADDIPPAVQAPKRRVIDVAKDALALMCEALQRLGDSCAIYGFSGDGHEHVEFHVAKDFADQLSVHTWAALAAMEPLRSTRMGTAIRHTLTKLLRQPERMKVLIIVSDGYPQDHDYGPDRKDDSYGIEDTACALREAERAGVLAFCVTIDPAGHDYLRRMCAPSRYMVIDDVMALPRELTKIYRTLTAQPKVF